MAEGTRFQTIEKCLEKHERNFLTINENIRKGREESEARLQGVERSLSEIQQVLAGMAQDRERHHHDPPLNQMLL